MSVDLLLRLSDPAVIRSQSRGLFNWVKDGHSPHFSVTTGRLGTVAEYVASECRRNFPQLEIPGTGRLEHLKGTSAGTSPRAKLFNALTSFNPDERSRRLIDYIFVSVLLDAGAGDSWRYRDTEGNEWRRSEGLAVATLDAFINGAFSATAQDPLRVDAAKLAATSLSDVESIFQISSDNAMHGLEGRALLLQSLGRALEESSVFTWRDEARPGRLIDTLKSRDSVVTAKEILRTLVVELRSIWPGRLIINGVSLGDVWRHSALGPANSEANLIPFHKLSQWLTYSVIEPLTLSGITVDGENDLTGLPEYRNGGLFLDLGAIELKNPHLTRAPLRPDEEAIVEWRALTVTMIDEIAPLVRALLARPQLSLPQLIEGGTWSAGRRLAQERRGGLPPLQIVSDGTVF